MRRLLKGLVVVSFVLSLTSTSVYAAPRRDDGDVSRSPLKKIVQIIKKIVKGLDGSDMSYPKP